MTSNVTKQHMVGWGVGWGELRKGPAGHRALEAVRPRLGGCPLLRGAPAPLPDSWEPQQHGVESEVCSLWLLTGEATRAA